MSQSSAAAPVPPLSRLKSQQMRYLLAAPNEERGARLYDLSADRVFGQALNQRRVGA